MRPPRCLNTPTRVSGLASSTPSTARLDARRAPSASASHEQGGRRGIEKHINADPAARTARGQQNATSVYTVAQVFPMLPERLSTDLTSLREGQERLAVVVEMVTDPDGAVVRSDLYWATVVNHARLAYHAVAPWLAGQGPAPPRVAAVPGLADQLRLQDRVAQALRARRFHRGALTLQTTEPQRAAVESPRPQ